MDRTSALLVTWETPEAICRHKSINSLIVLSLRFLRKKHRFIVKLSSHPVKISRVFFKSRENAWVQMKDKKSIALKMVRNSNDDWDCITYCHVKKQNFSPCHHPVFYYCRFHYFYGCKREIEFPQINFKIWLNRMTVNEVFTVQRASNCYEAFSYWILLFFTSNDFVLFLDSLVLIVLKHYSFWVNIRLFVDSKGFSLFKRPKTLVGVIYTW